MVAQGHCNPWRGKGGKREGKPEAEQPFDSFHNGLPSSFFGQVPLHRSSCTSGGESVPAPAI